MGDDPFGLNWQRRPGWPQGGEGTGAPCGFCIEGEVGRLPMTTAGLVAFPADACGTDGGSGCPYTSGSFPNNPPAPCPMIKFVG